jgi:hypothetical protein
LKPRGAVICFLSARVFSLGRQLLTGLAELDQTKGRKVLILLSYQVLPQQARAAAYLPCMAFSTTFLSVFPLHPCVHWREDWKIPVLPMG